MEEDISKMIRKRCSKGGSEGMCVRVGEVINRTAIEMKLVVMWVSEDSDERR